MPSGPDTLRQWQPITLVQGKRPCHCCTRDVSEGHKEIGLTQANSGSYDSVWLLTPLGTKECSRVNARLIPAKTGLDGSEMCSKAVRRRYNEYWCVWTPLLQNAPSQIFWFSICGLKWVIEEKFGPIRIMLRDEKVERVNTSAVTDF